MRGRKLLVASIGVAAVSYCGGKTVLTPPAPPDASKDAAQEEPSVFGVDASVDVSAPNDVTIQPYDGLVANLAPPPPDGDL